MKTIINKFEFEYSNKDFVDFFNEHGWVVVKNILSKAEIESLQVEYKEMKSEYADNLGVEIKKYESEITQWRNLWKRGGTFREIIFKDSGIHNIAKKSMKWQGVKLLHDHIITKPPATSTSIIPWHQDSMFWPVDVVGCSALTPLEDAEIESGCLELVDKSHLNGCEKPRDFMQDEKDDFNENSTRVMIPIKSGNTLLVHSLCWHRSSANISNKHRPMHISLWIHTGARWVPDLVDWHPVNKHVQSRSGEILQGDMFPEFGLHKDIKKPRKYLHEGVISKENEISMFNATKKITQQISELLGVDNDFDLSELLKGKENRHKIASKMIKNNIHRDEKILNDLLYRLWICASSYKTTKSRNVFNTTFGEWRKIIEQKRQL
ncbi:SnoK-like protein [uncultured Candidatus Thioglobus sp.]|nr:SnoK-like protein [uncultured Candidatus Thioglobus sp.]SMN01624.1 SnoK-like protein [uncultured Candidatus Thioglobus sp.]